MMLFLDLQKRKKSKGACWEYTTHPLTHTCMDSTFPYNTNRLWDRGKVISWLEPVDDASQSTEKDKAWAATRRGFATHTLHNSH